MSPQAPRPTGGTASAPSEGGRERAPELPANVRERLPERDPAALERFFDHYFERVHAYLRRLVHDETTAEDLTQDVFLHVHRSLPSYDAARPLSPWVYTIATNKVRDLWRSRRHQEERRVVALDGDDAPPVASGEGAPEDGLAADETSGEVAEAVAALPELLRETFVLRYYEGLSFEAIGALVERNETAIRKRYSRALAELRDALSHLATD